MRTTHQARLGWGCIVNNIVLSWGASCVRVELLSILPACHAIIAVPMPAQNFVMLHHLYIHHAVLCIVHNVVSVPQGLLSWLA
jgi:hypothetical protein